jgi:hypothetical protein
VSGIIGREYRTTCENKMNKYSWDRLVMVR